MMRPGAVIGLAAVAVLAIAGPWMLTMLVEYIQRTLLAIPTAVG